MRIFARLRWRWYVRNRAQCVGGPLDGAWLKRPASWAAFKVHGKPSYFVLELDSPPMLRMLNAVLSGQQGILYPGQYHLDAADEKYHWHRHQSALLTGRRSDRR